ncbi:hypothetical protein ACFFIF_01780 [Vagococcus entomophilus]|nr:hypothetical protein [Vagococcus entomophilus]
MNRKKVLADSKVKADKWYQGYKSTLLATQNIEKRKEWATCLTR